MSESHASDPAEQDPEHLSDAVRSLSGSVDALRADVKRIGATGSLPAHEAAQPDRSWVTTVAVPERPRLAVPRFLLEAAFLVACAVAAVIADLEPLVIAAVMAGAWILVALIELATSRADRYEHELLYAPPPVPTAQPSAPSADPAWFSPPVEQTIVVADETGATAVTRLPPRIADPEVTIEHRSEAASDDTIVPSAMLDEDTRH